MKLSKNFLGCGFLVAAQFAVGSCLAAPVTFFGEDPNPSGSGRVTPLNSAAARAAFLSSLVGVGTEDFEGFASGTAAPLGLTFAGSGGAITATLSGAGNVDKIVSGTSGGGRYPISGDNYYTTNSTNNTFSIVFSQAVAAFGFYGTDIGDFAGQITLTLANGAHSVLTIPTTVNAPNASLAFFGLIDAADPFVSIAFGSTSSSDFFGIDDLTIGDAGQVRVTPEPGSLALGALALAALAGVRRRSAHTWRTASTISRTA